MSLTARNTERTKFMALLALSQQQIAALEADDMLRFDEILTEKRILIESLTQQCSIVTADAALESLVSRIEDADKAAQRLLFAKVGVIMREMNRLNQQEKARGAYRREAPTAAPRPLGFLPDTPMFVDARS
jgi:uncharacterized protein YhaN